MVLYLAEVWKPRVCGNIIGKKNCALPLKSLTRWRVSGYILFPLFIFSVYLGGAWSNWSAKYSIWLVRFITFTVAPIALMSGVYLRVRWAILEFLNISLTVSSLITNQSIQEHPKCQSSSNTSIIHTLHHYSFAGFTHIEAFVCMSVELISIWKGIRRYRDNFSEEPR